MDRKDAAIYAAMFPRREARFWGSRAVVDPRIGPAEIARRTGISRSVVRSRLNAWRRIGFLLGYEVWPNPSLFGVRVAVIDIPLGEFRDVDRTFDLLRLVPGVLSARSLIDEGGRTLRAHVIDEGEPELSQRVELVRRLTGGCPGVTAERFWVPEVTVPLTALDWRIIAHYRAHPEASLPAAASALRISRRTLSRRRDRMIDGAALWWILDTHSARFPVAALYLRLSDRSDPARVREALDRALPAWIPCEAGGFGLAPSASLTHAAGLAFVDSPAAVGDVVRFAHSIPGVASVRARVPHDFRSYSQWIDRAVQIRSEGAQTSFGTPRQSEPWSPAGRPVQGSPAPRAIGILGPLPALSRSAGVRFPPSEPPEFAAGLRSSVGGSESASGGGPIEKPAGFAAARKKWRREPRPRGRA